MFLPGYLMTYDEALLTMTMTIHDPLNQELYNELRELVFSVCEPTEHIQ